MAEVKFLPGRVYALVGRNGVGKSTLLKNIHGRTILGISQDLDTFLLHQEVVATSKTVRDYVIDQDNRMAALERSLEEASEEEDIEAICSEMADLEESDDANLLAALSRFSMEEHIDTPLTALSGGERKRAGLCLAAFLKPEVLLLDEPTNHLDMKGIKDLVDFVVSISSGTVVVIVSHNRDLIDSVCTDVAELQNKTLTYYRGNYNDFQIQKQRGDLTQTRLAESINNERERIVKTMKNMHLAAANEKGSGKKRSKQISSRVKKLERTGVEKDKNGHRFKTTSSGTGRVGSINMTLDASTRKRQSFRAMLEAVAGVLHPYIDKEIQFKFEATTPYEFHEPLVKVEDAEYKFEGCKSSFLHAECCVEQWSRNIVIGANGSGKSTFIELMGGALNPTSGDVKFVQNLNVGLFSQMVADELLQAVADDDTPLSFLTKLYPETTEFDMRGELSKFGIGCSKVTLKMKMMSGGERIRIVLTMLMLKRPQILILDEPSNHLDLDSVHALGVGLGEWNGTVVLASHDSNLIRTMLEHSADKYDKKFFELVDVDKKWRLDYDHAVKPINAEDFEKYFAM